MTSSAPETSTPSPPGPSARDTGGAVVARDYSSWPTWLRQEFDAPALADIADADGVRAVLERAGIRVAEVRVPAGGRLPAHRHDRSVLQLCIAAGTSRQHWDDGTVSEHAHGHGELLLTEVEAGGGFVHDIENLGDADLVLLEVELPAPTGPEEPRHD